MYEFYRRTLLFVNKKRCHLYCHTLMHTAQTMVILICHPDVPRACRYNTLGIFVLPQLFTIAAPGTSPQ
jgi:hypothetical protein